MSDWIGTILRITMRDPFVGQKKLAELHANSKQLPTIDIIKNYIAPNKEQIEWQIGYDTHKYGYLKVVPLTKEEIEELQEKENESNSQVSKSRKKRKQRSTKKNSTKHGV